MNLTNPFALDEIMMKRAWKKWERASSAPSHRTDEIVEEPTTEPSSQNEEVKPQFGFKLGEVQTPESFIGHSRKGLKRTKRSR